MLDFLVGNDALSAIVAFALVLIPAIFIHEMGHFLAAKAVGITILEFGIGFPPRMLTLFTRGETEYTLNWLPIGGFVRPLGEDFVRPVSDDEASRDRKKVESRLFGEAKSDSVEEKSERERLRARGIKRVTSVSEARPLARIVFMAAGSTANLLTAIILFTIIGLSGVPTVVGVSSGIVSLETTSPLAAAGVQVGDLIKKVNGEYFAGTQDFINQWNAADGKELSLQIQRSNGDILDIEVTPTDSPFENYVFISSVAAGSPAAAAGLRVDDIIIAFNGEPLDSFEALPRQTQSHLGQEITLTILRASEKREVRLTPRTDPPPGEGAMGIGIFPAYGDPSSGVVLVDGAAQQDVVSLNLAESFGFSLERIRFFVETLLQLPGQLLAGSLNAEETRIISPLGISQFGGMFLQQSIQEDQPVLILNFIAIISIALGITNLLPLPALDGGRIVFVLLEILRGKPIAPEREGIVHLIGMALLLSLMAIAFLNDILNPVTGMIP
jgi:regulator of sigma E protease